MASRIEILRSKGLPLGGLVRKPGRHPRSLRADCQKQFEGEPEGRF